MRVAVYYAPAPADPLWQAAGAWLGRDPETAAMVPQPAIEGIEAVTAEPRLYGFHATLKPPMRLATSYAAFMDGVRAMAARLAPFELTPLHVADLRGFLALRETAPCPALQALADACVAGLDAHRAPADAAELARRRKHGLPPAQEAMLAQWGYPHVFETWFFHMTLTRRLSAEERDVFLPAAEGWFSAALRVGRVVDALTVFTQVGPGAPFLVAERVGLG